MTDKHTPGPWRVVEHEIWDTRGDGEPGIPLFRRVSGYRRWGRDLKAGEAEANARLIASAPDMATRITALEAEKAELVEALEPLARKKIPSNGTGNAGAYSIYHSDIRRARTTLAKARQSEGGE